MDIAKALSKNVRKLLRYPNVVAVGRGLKEVGGQRTDTMSIVCSVTRKVPDVSLRSAEAIPREVGGNPTDVIESGELVAFSTDRYRPAPGGVSIGHVDVTAGTLGCLVTKDDKLFILSNNHVLANSNSAHVGDDIVQPGVYDGGTVPADVIATLHQFEPIVFDGEVSPSPCPVASGLAMLANLAARSFGSKSRLIPIREAPNLVDAALALPKDSNDVSMSILDIGPPVGTTEATLGMGLMKSGRTTGLTHGEVLQVDVTAKVSYGDGKVATFEDQLMAGGMSQPGDSGSIILDDSRNVVGLLFAGSDTTTIFSKIENVLYLFGVDIVTPDWEG